MSLSSKLLQDERNEFGDCSASDSECFSKENNLLLSAWNLFDEMSSSSLDEWRSPNRILEVAIHRVCYPVTELVLHQVFGSFGGVVEQILVIEGTDVVLASLAFDSVEIAADAYGELHSRNIYDGCCKMQIKWGSPTPTARDADKRDSMLALSAAPSSSVLVAAAAMPTAAVSVTSASASASSASTPEAPIPTATTALISEEDFESDLPLCDVLDQAPLRWLTTTTASSPATSTSPPTTTPAAATAVSVTLTPASSVAASVTKMRDEVDQQQIPAANPRRPRPFSLRSVPPSSPRTPSPLRCSVSDAEERAAFRLRAVEEEHKALKQALAWREGELQLVQMKYADESGKLMVVQRQLTKLTEDEVSRTLPDRCLMHCLTIIPCCFPLPFSCSWDAVLCWQHRPWPPPSGPQSVSSKAELRPLPWSSFDMVERNVVMSASSRLWKPPWYVSSQQSVMERRYINSSTHVLSVSIAVFGVAICKVLEKVINQNSVMLEPALAILFNKELGPPCLQYCHIVFTSILQSCSSSGKSITCGWVGRHQMQPWPPPVQFEMLSDHIQLMLVPWPSFCYHMVVLNEASVHVLRPKPWPPPMLIKFMGSNSQLVYSTATCVFDSGKKVHVEITMTVVLQLRIYSLAAQMGDNETIISYTKNSAPLHSMFLKYHWIQCEIPWPVITKDTLCYSCGVQATLLWLNFGYKCAFICIHVYQHYCHTQIQLSDICVDRKFNWMSVTSLQAIQVYYGILSFAYLLTDLALEFWPGRCFWELFQHLSVPHKREVLHCLVFLVQQQLCDISWAQVRAADMILLHLIPATRTKWSAAVVATWLWHRKIKDILVAQGILYLTYLSTDSVRGNCSSSWWGSDLKTAYDYLGTKICGNPLTISVWRLTAEINIRLLLFTVDGCLSYFLKQAVGAIGWLPLQVMQFYHQALDGP